MDGERIGPTPRPYFRIERYGGRTFVRDWARNETVRIDVPQDGLTTATVVGDSNVALTNGDESE